VPKQYDDIPTLYQDLARQWGPPIGIEETRKRWSKVVTAAGNGTITLIARDAPGRGPLWAALIACDAPGRGPRWAALVPLAEVAAPAEACPVWPLRAARKDIGQLVDDAVRWPGGRTQLLSNRRTLVAALVPAAALADRHLEVLPR
jgi:hypothetical protein